MHNPTHIQDLVKIVTKTKAISSEITVILVANLRDTTPVSDDYDESSIVAEFYCEEELDEVLSGLRTFGFHVIVYTDENKFFMDVLGDKLSEQCLKYFIVYNTAQNGTGPGRQTLVSAFYNLQRILL